MKGPQAGFDTNLVINSQICMICFLNDTSRNQRHPCRSTVHGSQGHLNVVSVSRDIWRQPGGVSLHRVSSSDECLPWWLLHINYKHCVPLIPPDGGFRHLLIERSRGTGKFTVWSIATLAGINQFYLSDSVAVGVVAIATIRVLAHRLLIEINSY